MLIKLSDNFTVFFYLYQLLLSITEHCGCISDHCQSVSCHLSCWHDFASFTGCIIKKLWLSFF